VGPAGAITLRQQRPSAWTGLRALTTGPPTDGSDGNSHGVPDLTVPAAAVAPPTLEKPTELPPAINLETLQPLSDDFNEEEFLARIEAILPRWEAVWNSLSTAEIDQKLSGLNFDELNSSATRKWENTGPLVRTKKVDKLGRAYGTGRRKRSTACVWIRPGTGEFTVNKRQLPDYFDFDLHSMHAFEPLQAVRKAGAFNVHCTVFGGGLGGQAGAIRLGLARALQNFDPELRRILKPLGMLTRDSRVVEQKKPGQHKARKKYQWVKR